MTAEQLDAARSTQDYHAEQFGYSNVEFHQGFLEHLDELDFGFDNDNADEDEDGKFDLIISNCVLNLCQDKKAVLEHCHSLLKEGGEMYFSDVYASRRVSMELQSNKVMWGECLSGALYWNDFEDLSREVGFKDPRLVEDSPITILNAELQQVMAELGEAGLEFYSATYRLWKNSQMEHSCEDYGQAIKYKGTLERYPSGWLLDKNHYFETGKIEPVCGNTYRMIAESPTLAKDFECYGDFKKHYGHFEGCGQKGMPFDAHSSASTGGKDGSTKGSCC